MFTIDASVWVNAESPGEPSQADSRAFIHIISTRAIPTFVPTLVVPEIAGAIARVRGDAALAGRLALALQGLPLGWIALDESLARTAADLAAAHRLRGTDSVYAAVALTNNCDLVSLDREHLTRLTGVVRTLTPSAALARLRSSP